MSGPRPPVVPRSGQERAPPRGVLSLTGPGTPRAHDVRAVASSWALFEGVPLDDILSSAVWRSPNSFIACYLTDVVQDEGRFGRAALRVRPSAS